jgi:dethiobiotin synthetase
MTILFVTGTGTGVGKTIATAAVAAHARRAGVDVAVCKPVQTGCGSGAGDGDDDLAEIARLAGVTELDWVARYPEPLAPVAAAAAAGLPLPTAEQLLAAVRRVDRPGRLTLVEGAGGLLVEIADAGVTLRDLAIALGAPVLVVCEAGLGTLNHTALTLEALNMKGISAAGLVIGSWPDAPVRAVLPAGAAALSPRDFAEMAWTAFDPGWFTGLT